MSEGIPEHPIRHHEYPQEPQYRYALRVYSVTWSRSARSHSERHLMPLKVIPIATSRAGQWDSPFEQPLLEPVHDMRVARVGEDQCVVQWWSEGPFTPFIGIDPSQQIFVGNLALHESPDPPGCRWPRMGHPALQIRCRLRPFVCCPPTIALWVWSTPPWAQVRMRVWARPHRGATPSAGSCRRYEGLPNSYAPLDHWNPSRCHHGFHVRCAWMSRPKPAAINVSRQS